MSAAYFSPKYSIPNNARMLTLLPQSLHRRLVVVSNRLPIRFTNEGQAELSSGGMVTAMVPVLNKQGGLWLGWPGTWGDFASELDRFSAHS